MAIAAPAERHAARVREALTAGKDVFVEKPLCVSVSEGEELVALARRLGRILMVGHLLWYHSAVLRLRELIDGGELGRIQYIYSSRLNLGRIRREENILEQKLVVVGDRAMAVFNDVEQRDKLVLYPHSIDWRNQMSHTTIRRFDRLCKPSVIPASRPLSSVACWRCERNQRNQRNDATDATDATRRT